MGIKSDEGEENRRGCGAVFRQSAGVLWKNAVGDSTGGSGYIDGVGPVRRPVDFDSVSVCGGRTSKKKRRYFRQTWGGRDDFTGRSDNGRAEGKNRGAFVRSEKAGRDVTESQGIGETRCRRKNSR